MAYKQDEHPVPAVIFDMISASPVSGHYFRHSHGSRPSAVTMGVMFCQSEFAIVQFLECLTAEYMTLLEVQDDIQVVLHTWQCNTTVI